MLTAAQIVADALAMAKCPGFTSQGGRALNLVLADLVLHRNLKINCVTASIAVNASSIGPYSLESDYLRTYEMKYVLNGQPYFLNPCTLRQFDGDNVPYSGSNYPSEYATDLSPVANQLPGLLYIYPTCNQALSLTHRYMVQRPDIAAPETSGVIPWFPDQDYLMHATAMRMMRITDDTRYERFEKDCEDMLRLHLMTEGDEQQVVKSVQLDPRVFRCGGGSRPTKLSPF